MTPPSAVPSDLERDANGRLARPGGLLRAPAGADFDRRLVALQILARASAALTRSLEPRVTVNAVVQAPLPDFAEWAALDVNDGAGHLRREAIAHAEPERVAYAWELYRRWPPNPADETGIYKVWRSGTPELIPVITDEMIDQAARDEEQRAHAHALQMGSYLSVPVIDEDQRLGVLTFVRGKHVRAFDHEDLLVAVELARGAATALGNAARYDRERRALAAAEEARRRAELLQHVAADLTRGLTRDQVTRVVTRHVVNAIGATAGGVVELTPDGTEFLLLATVGYDEAVYRRYARHPVDAPIPVRDVVRRRAAVFLPDRAAWDAEYTPMTIGDGAWAALPLQVEQTLFGALTLSFPAPREFGAADRRFLQAFADLCAQALERARLYELERALRADAEEANRLKTDLLAFVSHEFRTPLQSIQSNVEIMRLELADGASAGLRGAVDRIDRAQQRLHGRINDLLHFAQLSAGAIQLREEAVALEDVVREAVLLVETHAQAKGIEIRITARHDEARDADVAIGPRVWADRERLEQILVNLLSNAIKFTPATHVDQPPTVIRVHLARDPVTPSLVQVLVQDSGIGIPGDRLASIFEPFVRVRAEGGSHRRGDEGTGLGLPISRDLARRMGGDLTAASIPGTGSTFTLHLRVVER